ncbi:MAG: anti-sigma factor [Burkholderiaceae bacterium]
MNLRDPDVRTVACAEFVLGTLSDSEFDAFIAALARDPALRVEVGQWQDRLLPLLDRLPTVAPPPGLWQRIESALGPLPTPLRPPVVATAEGRGPPLPPRPAPSRAQAGIGWWERLAFWRLASGLALAASVVLATLLLTRPAPELSYVAVLTSQDGRQAGWVVRASDRGPVRLTALGPPGPIPEGRAWQFWTKGKTAANPTSLGLVPPEGRLEVPRERLPDLGDEQLFEITLEPATGSPTGRPTGPILFVGRASPV